MPQERRERVDPTKKSPGARKGIAEWLASIGLSEYAQRFADNAIDFSIIRDLTEQDLKDLGVLLGHRRKILRAIAELDGVASAPIETATEPVLRDEAGSYKQNTTTAPHPLPARRGAPASSARPRLDGPDRGAGLAGGEARAVVRFEVVGCARTSA